MKTTLSFLVSLVCFFTDGKHYFQPDITLFNGTVGAVRRVWVVTDGEKVEPEPNVLKLA